MWPQPRLPEKQRWYYFPKMPDFKMPSYICLVLLLFSLTKQKTKNPKTNRTRKNTSGPVFAELKLLLNVFEICWVCAEEDHQSEPRVGRRGSLGSAILWVESFPGNEEWSVSLPLLSKPTTFSVWLSREARALWTLERASGLTVKPGLRRTLQNKLLPDEIRAIDLDGCQGGKRQRQKAGGRAS